VGPPRLHETSLGRALAAVICQESVTQTTAFMTHLIVLPFFCKQYPVLQVQRLCNQLPFFSSHVVGPISLPQLNMVQLTSELVTHMPPAEMELPGAAPGIYEGTLDAAGT